MPTTDTPPTNAQVDRPWRRRSDLWSRESQIRQLADAGWSAAQIRKLLGLRVSEARLRQFLRVGRAAAAPAPAATALADVLQAWRRTGRDAPTTPREFGAAWLAALPPAVRRQISGASQADLARLARMLFEAYPALSASEWRSVLAPRSPARGPRSRAGKEFTVGAAPAAPQEVPAVTPPARAASEVAGPSTSNPITQALDEAEARQPDISRFFERKE